MTLNHQEQLFYAARQVLLAHWDPIGVHAFRIGDNEYDSYIPKILPMLRDQVGDEAIARHLAWIRTDKIGLPPRVEEDLRAARLLREAYEQHQAGLTTGAEAPGVGITPEELALEAARYTLAAISIEEMQSVLNRLMEEGAYQDAFYDVLYPEHQVTEVVGAAFEKALRSIGVPVPAYEDAVWVILHFYLRKIASGAVDPYLGLKRLMYEVYWRYDFWTKSLNFLGDSHQIEWFIGLFWAYDDLQDTSAQISFNGAVGEAAVEELKKEILAEAKRWVSAFHFPQA